MSKNDLLDEPELRPDLTLPHTQRPMTGLDLETWRGELGISKHEAQYCLGLRNSAHYNRLCAMAMLPYTIELMVRMYYRLPEAPGFIHTGIKPAELFERMYGKALEEFKGTEYEVAARVDLRARFTKLFDRSKERSYSWLNPNPKKTANAVAAYSDVACILVKLRHADDPGEFLEEMGKRVWRLRGVDLDREFPIPTPEHPPSREKSGRKVGQTYSTPRKPTGPKKPAAKKPAAKPAKKAASAARKTAAKSAKKASGPKKAKKA